MKPLSECCLFPDFKVYQKAITIKHHGTGIQANEIEILS